MILAPSTFDLLVRLVSAHHQRMPRVVPQDEGAAASLMLLGLATGEREDGILMLRATTPALELPMHLARVNDVARVSGARTGFGRVVGMNLPNHGRTCKLHIVQSDRILEIELPSDCFIVVLP